MGEEWREQREPWRGAVVPASRATSDLRIAPAEDVVVEHAKDKNGSRDVEDLAAEKKMKRGWGCIV